MGLEGEEGGAPRPSGAFGWMEFIGAPLVSALVRSECGDRISNMELLDFNHAD
jgi:hypothetical protein